MNESADHIAPKRTRIKKLALPPLVHLQECFTYEAATGRLIWNPRPRDHFESDWQFMRWNACFSGKEAGSKQTGKNGRPSCIRLRLRNPENGVTQNYVAHCIIASLLGWEVGDGDVIDHKNGNAWDNRLDNLRKTTQQRNAICRTQNINKVDNLYLGVTRTRSGKYAAVIAVNKRNYYLGTFDTAEQARDARIKKQTELYGADFVRDHPEFQDDGSTEVKPPSIIAP